MAKSDVYQWKICEIGIQAKDLNNFAEDRSISAILARNETEPRIKELQEELIELVLSLIDSGLTEHQQKVLKLHLAGQTQHEIAVELGCTQSAVHKCLHGNIDYKNRDEAGRAKVYGGAVRRLAKLSAKSARIQIILKQIESIKRDRQ